VVNTLGPGDTILAFETGHFATLWRDMAVRLGLAVDNETSTGVISPVADVRKAIVSTGHPALLLVDAISSVFARHARHAAATRAAVRTWGLEVVCLDIGHLGHFNDLILAGTLVGVQMGLQLAGVPIDPSGVNAALDVLRA
jgi:aspartate aminotransferase-like enzyme